MSLVSRFFCEECHGPFTGWIQPKNVMCFHTLNYNTDYNDVNVIATTTLLLLKKQVHSFIRQLNWSIIKDRKNNVTQMNDKSSYFPNKTSTIFLLSLKAEGHFICKNDKKCTQKEA
jgi:hypothetical protein